MSLYLKGDHTCIQCSEQSRLSSPRGSWEGERTKKAARSQAQHPCRSVCGVEESLSFVATEELGVTLRLVNGMGGSQNRKVWHF